MENQRPETDGGKKTDTGNRSEKAETDRESGRMASAAAAKKADEKGILNKGLHFGKKLSRENMIVITLLGVLLMIIAIPVKKTQSDPETGLADSRKHTIETEMDDSNAGSSSAVSDSSDGPDAASAEEYAKAMELRLERLLSEMEGVGEVRVMVTLSSTAEQVVEKDIPQSSDSTKETDSSGGTRQVSGSRNEESTIFTTDSSGRQIPYVKKILEPKVEGITVVAQGGANALVQAEVAEVIQALFDVEAHKIKVVRMKTS